MSVDQALDWIDIGGVVPDASTPQYWTLDPIDGTRAFLRKRPQFSVSVALAVDGRPVAGVVFNPATDEFFDGEAGRGARLNGAPIRVSARVGVAGVDGEVLPWDTSLVATLYGIDDNSALALRYFMKDLMFDLHC